MADSLSPKTYAGKAAAGFMSASLLSGETLAKGNLTVLPNVAYKVNLNNFNLTTAAVADVTCDFTSAGDINYAEKALAPKRLQVNKQLCKNDWLSTWAGANMRAGLDGSLQTDFATYLISYAGSLVGQQVETSIWSGAAGNSGEFDGFQALLTADAAVVDVAAVGGGLNAANIIAQIGRVRDAIPNAVYGQDDTAIYMGTAAFKFYISAQAALGYLNQYHAGVTESNFEGIPIIWSPGMAANVMIVGRKSNMFFATDLEGDLTEVKLLDQTMVDGSDNVNLVMRFNAGVGFSTGADMVLYA
tara:strand:+ start:1141 stop:2043 length:903 start_codon:yes stop_codon:yes gene_type:complete